MVPNALNITLAEAREQSSELREAAATDQGAAEVIRFAQRLNGVVRNVSTHAAGVVISQEPLTENVPLRRPVNDAGGAEGEVAGVGFVGFVGVGREEVDEDAVVESLSARGEADELDFVGAGSEEPVFESADGGGVVAAGLFLFFDDAAVDEHGGAELSVLVDGGDVEEDGFEGSAAFGADVGGEFEVVVEDEVVVVLWVDDEDAGFDAVGSAGELVGGDDAVDETAVECFLSGETSSGEEDFHGPGPGDLSGESDVSAGVGDDAPADFLEAELCVFGGDADVGAQHVFQAAGDAVTVDGGEDGFGDVVEVAGLFDFEGFVARGGGFGGDGGAEVGAGAEGALAGAGDDGQPEVGVVFEFVDGVSEELEEFGGHGVHALGSVEGDGAALAGVVLLEEERGLFGHVGLQIGVL